jgi:type IV pilus assembly protein PilB
MTFLETLVERGLVPENKIAEIKKNLSEHEELTIDELLVASGLDEAKLVSMKSELYGVPSTPVDLKAINSDILKYIPEDSVNHYHFVPIGLTDGVLGVGVLDPSNIGAMDALQFISARVNVPFKVFIISLSDYKSIVNMYKGISGEVDQALSELDADVLDVDSEGVETGIENIQTKLKPGEEERIVEDAPIIKIVAVILRHATEGNASDIHIENTGDKVKVRFRVDGVLHTSLMLPLNVYAGIVARIKILSKLRLDEKRKPQDGGFSAKIEGRKIDFRVSTLPAYYGEKVVMRILDSQRGVKPIDGLDLSPENLIMVREALKKPYGLILITGPTGSGKTTTLYSMLNDLDREKSNVVSLEDPVEYHIPDMNQSQVMPEIGYTFASGLRSILRQDPDIIMVGEIRDKETAQLAIQAALTGHLVFSTLHTNNAIGVIPRLIDMGVDPYLIAPTLVLAIAQRLVRLVCPNSRKEVPLDEVTKKMIDTQFADLPGEYKDKLGIGNSMYQVVPSSDCPGGTRGRMAVFEMFAVDKDMQNVILKNPTDTEIYKSARAKGMLSMREDAMMKSLKGDIAMQEVYTFN